MSVHLPLEPVVAFVLAASLSLSESETVRIPNHPVQVTFVGVESDSRCPTGVTCVWEGDAAVRIAVRRDDDSPELLLLHTADAAQRRGRAAGFTFVLDRLEPRPTADRPVPAGAYRLLLTVTAD
ncbi:MAG: hypothetical protein IT178_06465 [Acidobacteria bacterium]|nr:hypothetical protein [Acidobacteriota bacterium]